MGSTRVALGILDSYRIPMASIRLHRRRWKASVRVPKSLEAREGTKFRYRNVTATDRKAAELEAQVWETSLRVAFGFSRRPAMPCFFRPERRRQSTGSRQIALTGRVTLTRQSMPQRGSL